MSRTSSTRRPRSRWLERLLRATGWICVIAAVALAAEGQIYQYLGRWQLGAVDPAAAVAEHTRAAGVWLGREAGAIEDPRLAWVLDTLAEETARLPWDEWFKRTADRLSALDRQIEDRYDAAAGRPILAPGTPLGTIAIPELGLDAVVLEGVGEDVLRRGVGHFPQTPMPGDGGNFALAGHRDTFFRALRHVEPGQRMVVKTADGRERVYKVETTEVVEPTRVEVLDDGGGETLTLITCYPFRYVGPAPQRFVVRGRLSAP
jgi:sortase A